MKILFFFEGMELRFEAEFIPRVGDHIDGGFLTQLVRSSSYDVSDEELEEWDDSEALVTQVTWCFSPEDNYVYIDLELPVREATELTFPINGLALPTVSDKTSN